MAEVRTDLVVCIPTYRRPELLRLLLDDLNRQTVLPEQVVVVDGEGSSPKVRAVLESRGWAFPLLWHIPSNHANLPFQRYVGRLAAVGFARLVYLDDDLRITRRDVLQELLWPLDAGTRDVAAVTGRIYCNRDSAQSRTRGAASPAGFTAQWFGAADRLRPGGLSPVGFRKEAAAAAEPYAFVGWLRGGCMAFSVSALTEECFSEDVFAAYERRLGRGEDTVLACRLGRSGKIVEAREAAVEHPGSDVPQAYPARGFRSGYALAYSRRLINDNYRGSERVTWRDRLALGKHYLWMNGSNLAQMFRCPSRNSVSFGSGYFWGALQGAYRSPRAARLTSGVDWRADARACLRHAVLRSKVAVCR